MKIRTITCHDVANYGASLQAFALQTYLSGLGHDVKIIDYLPEYSKPYNFWRVAPSSHLYKPAQYSFLVLIFWAAREYLRMRPTFKRRDAFKAFNQKYLRLTTHYATYAELANNPPEADVYIAGSDQIWRTNLNNGKDPAYYLQFGTENIRRISYAASFGLPRLTDGMDYLIKTYLSALDAISVRESSGLDILTKLKLEGTLVTDPVFLLSRTEWTDLLNIRERKIKDPYILVYDLNKNCLAEQKIAFARQYAKAHGLKIVAVNDVRKTPYAQININDGGPADFVNLIANADFVVSDSFHATAFSCIMHVPFRVYFDMPQAARIKDFLNILDLSHCINCPVNSEYEIDWDTIQRILDSKITDAKTYLADNIK